MNDNSYETGSCLHRKNFISSLFMAYVSTIIIILPIPAAYDYLGI